MKLWIFALCASLGVHKALGGTFSVVVGSTESLCLETNSVRIAKEITADRGHHELTEDPCSSLGFTRLLYGSNTSLATFVKAAEAPKLDVLSHVANIITSEKHHDQVGVCWKRGVARTGFLPPPCTKNQVMQLDRCFERCKPTQGGIGPICFDDCRGDYPVTAGIMCCKTSEVCQAYAKKASKIGLDLVKLGLDLRSKNYAAAVAELKQLGADAEMLELPVCP
eukprot:CAMPEP_0184544242 /NCGR_PEP_ID=MMETSP0199_2-20130426/3489_1 /TAXON_ID=1112570 /ORGANISM="Thraustochytrium sp., Strain LLF1b" /LENGTH=222 /DNA_ID=CAMNT_0026938389 /DNA_START=45 /DNA_END=713 /DNA_ORIENTATION=-